MNDSENINVLDKIKNNKKAIGENAQIIVIILLIAFILVDAIIILYLINENDKYHVIYPDVSKLEASQIKEYLNEKGFQVNLNEKGQVVVAKEEVETATLQVAQNFFSNNQNEDLVEREETEEITENQVDANEVNFENLAKISELEQQVKISLEKHVAVKSANVRIEDFDSTQYDVTAIVLITTETGIDLSVTDIDNIKWGVASMIEGCEEENITIINAETNAPFKELTEN